MHCSVHEDAESVATCFECGAAMCEACREHCIVVKGSHMLCPECAPEALRKNLHKAEEARTRSIKALASCLALMLAGIAYTLFSYFTGGSAQNILIAAVFFFGIAGLPTLWITLRAEDEDGNKAPVALPEFAKKAMITFSFGLIGAPLISFLTYKAMRHFEEEIKNCEQLLQTYS